MLPNASAPSRRHAKRRMTCRPDQRLSDSDQLDAPIVGAAFERVVGVLRLRPAIAGRGKPIRTDPLLGDEGVLYRCSAPPREIQVGRVAAYTIRVAIDLQLPLGMTAQNLGDVLERQL